MTFDQVTNNYSSLLDEELRALLCTSPDALPARHYGMMQYHMGWLDAEFAPSEAPVGKRVRPLLCLLVCAAAGGDPRVAMPAAAGVELLHNFSLIHDDIEDNSLTRRHRPTVWKAFGLPQALNVGDGMFSVAHLAFYRLLDLDVPADTVLRVLHVFDQTCVALTEGQHLDMAFEERAMVSAEAYMVMIADKTGALLAAAAQIGAMLAGAPPASVEAYRRFGAALGQVFQLQDDILGIWGDEEKTGKSTASDILAKKKTLPVLYAMAHERVGIDLRLRYAGPPFTAADLPEILACLDAAGARTYVATQVNKAATEARETLRSMAAHGDPDFHPILAEMLDQLLARRS